jgi:ferredoxin-NADP reductase
MTERGDGLANRRRFRLIGRQVENPLVTSFALAPVEGPLWPFKGGQFVPVEIPSGGPRPHLRTYSISSAPSETGHYRLSVKRETAKPGPDAVPAFSGSNWLHDAFHPGDEIMLHAPRGDFVLDGSDRSVVFIAGGIGLTPLLSMFAELAAAGSRRPIHFIHAVHSADFEAFGDELDAIARRHGRAKVMRFHEEAMPGLLPQGRHAGRISMEALRDVLPFDDHEFYLCGPSGFMQALYGGLTGLNVQPDRIRYEFFGPATVLHPARLASPAGTPPAPAQLSRIVRFVRSAIETDWSDPDTSILDLAEANGIDGLFSCREGVCGTCQCRLISGEVDYRTEPVAWIEPGNVLTCIASPKTDLELDM